MASLSSSSSSGGPLEASSVGALIASGLGAGLVHVATSPDHLSVFLVLSAGTNWRAGELGALWGAGHSLSLLVTASIYLATDRGLDMNGISFVLDFLVGLLMVLLGLWALNKYLDIRKRVSRGECVRAILSGNDDDLARLYDALDDASCASSPSVLAGFGPFWSTTESLQLELGPQNRPVDSFKMAGRRRWCGCNGSSSHTTTRRVISLVYGIIHGLAGQDGALAALSDDHVLDDYGKCVAYLLAESAMSTLAMAAFAALYGEVSGRVMRRSDALYYRVGIASALVSLAVGLLWIVLVETGELDNVFG